MATGDAGSPKESPTVPVDLGPIGPRQRYEFTPAQESVIGDLAGKMRFVGAFMFALGFLGLVRVIYVAWKNRGLEGSFDIDSLITTIIYSLIGFWTLSASKGFASKLGFSKNARPSTRCGHSARCIRCCSTCSSRQSSRPSS